MKKFMKGCAITALVLLILGSVMAVAAVAVKGTTSISEVVESVTGGKLHVDLDPWDNDWGIFSGEGYYDIEKDVLFDEDHAIVTSGNVEKSALGTDITNLDIEVGGCEFRFAESEDNSFYLTAHGMGKIQFYVEEGTLYIKSTHRMGNVSDLLKAIKGHKIILYVPSDYHFEGVDIEMGAGLLEVNGIMTEDIHLEVGAGSIEVDFLQAKQCNVEVGMGEIVVNDMQIGDVLDTEVGMGSLIMEGTVQGDLTADCSMGAIQMEIAGNENDFNYEIGAAMGTVSIGREEYSGLSHEKTIDNAADKTISVDCAMGAVEITFR